MPSNTKFLARSGDRLERELLEAFYIARAEATCINCPWEALPTKKLLFWCDREVMVSRWCNSFFLCMYISLASSNKNFVGSQCPSVVPVIFLSSSLLRCFLFKYVAPTCPYQAPAARNYIGVGGIFFMKSTWLIALNVSLPDSWLSLSILLTFWPPDPSDPSWPWVAAKSCEASCFFRMDVRRLELSTFFNSCVFL